MNDRLRAWMSIFVTLFTLVICVLILTSPNSVIRQPADDAWQKAAIGWIGFIIGYWLK